MSSNLSGRQALGVALLLAVAACHSPARLAGPAASRAADPDPGALPAPLAPLPGEAFLPVAEFLPDDGAARAPLLAYEDPATTKSLSPGYGHLRLRVRWPRQIQRLPASSNTLIVTIYDPLGAVINKTTLKRPTGPGGDLITDTTITIPAARHLTIWARAYRETNVNEAVHVPVAVATAAGNVHDNAVLRVSLDLLYVPIKWAHPQPVVPNNGGPGAFIQLSGSGFHGFIDPFNATPSFVVRFTRQTVLEGNSPQFPVLDHTATPSPVPTYWPGIASPSAGTDLWVNATGATRSSDLLITAPVPSGAVNGPVQILVDGLPAVPQSTASIPTFTVLSTIDVTPRVPGGLTSFPASLRTGSVQFTCRATDSLKAHFAHPAVTWTSSNTRVGVVDQTGLFTPLIVGTTTIKAKTGVLEASVPIAVRSDWSTADYKVIYPDLGFATVSGPVGFPDLSQGALTGEASNR